MQDIRTVGVGGGGQLFGGSGGNRRLRASQNHHHHHQALKCPRCDSANTKFCYYNNYNLSQPRHFCKSCRRYWTKGGVLRNVPIGGGCRKTRCPSKPKALASSCVADAALPCRNSNSQSSSESSSLTASTIAAAGIEVASAVSPYPFPGLLNFNSSQISNPSSDDDALPPPPIEQSSVGGGIFPSEAGSFTEMMSSSSDPWSTEFNMAGISDLGYLLQLRSAWTAVQDHYPQQWTQQPLKVTSEETATMPDDLKMQFLGQTNQIDHLSGNHSGLGTLDRRPDGGGGDQELYDLTATVDLSYWSQTQ